MSHLPIIGLLSYVFDLYIGLRLKIKLYVDPSLYIYINQRIIYNLKLKESYPCYWNQDIRDLWNSNS